MYHAWFFATTWTWAVGGTYFLTELSCRIYKKFIGLSLCLGGLDHPGQLCPSMTGDLAYMGSADMRRGWFASSEFDVVGGPRGRGFSRESRAVTLDKGLFVICYWWSNEAEWSEFVKRTYACFYFTFPLPSNRHHRRNGDCLEGKRENYQICSVQYCVQQLCTVQCTHIWTDLTVLWIGFCLTGPISPC